MSAPPPPGLHVRAVQFCETRRAGSRRSSSPRCSRPSCDGLLRLGRRSDRAPARPAGDDRRSGHRQQPKCSPTAWRRPAPSDHLGDGRSLAGGARTGRDRGDSCRVKQQHPAPRRAQPRPAFGVPQASASDSAARVLARLRLARHSALDDREQRVCRQGRDDRYALPSDNRVIEVAAVPWYGPCPCNT